MPPFGFDESEPQSYGILTQAAVALPEIEAPARPRIYCMAVTNENISGAIASGWSAALDQAAVGRMIADGEDIEPADTKWMLGEDSISAGSLHCDVWTGPAIELTSRDTICVKPVNGWWRNRASTEIVNRKSRYALIVTLKAQNAELDIYNPVRTSIGLPVPVNIDVIV